MLQDCRYALRLFRRAPAFSLLAVVTLALGIGATTSMFTIVHAVLLRPLPYRNPEQLVILRADSPEKTRAATLADAEIADIRDASTVFTSVGAMTAVDGNLTGGESMERVSAASATDGFLQTLGVVPALGRLLENRIDSTTNTVLSVLISDELWRRRFNADPSVVGRQFDINNKSLTVAGVLPRGFRVHLGPDANVPERIDIWFPTGLSATERQYRSHTAVARLAPGVSLARAQQELDAIAARAGAQYAVAYGNRPPRFHAEPLHEDTVRAARPALLALMGAVSFVLLIACANVANLLLARTTGRARELGIRTAIGAARGRLIRQLVTEGLVLGTCGGAAGLALALTGQSALDRLRPADVPSMPASLLDFPVLVFALAATLGASILFSLAPAIKGTATRVAEALQAGSRADTGRGSRLRSSLVIAEVALSILLLTGAGVMIRTLLALRSVDAGFLPDHVLTLQASLRPQRSIRVEHKWRFYQDAMTRLRSLPGVTAVSAVRPLPLEGLTFADRVEVDGRDGEILVDSQVVLPDYFSTLRIRQVAGRDFAAADVEQKRPVAIVDEDFARTAWPGANPIGRRLQIRGGSRGDKGWAEVVGVMGHVRSAGLRGAGRPQVYLPYHAFALYDLAVVMRTTGEPAALADAAKRAIEGLGGQRPVHHVRPMTAYLDQAMADTRFAVTLLGAFAFIALLLSAVGIYGVIAVITAQRTREFGVRLALGADPAGIRSLVLREGMKWTAMGIGAGALASLALMRYLDALVYGVRARDPLTLAAVSVVLAIAAATACYVPARRAARLEPAVALRAD
jgi:putative ABC transport system permease protein